MPYSVLFTLHGGREMMELYQHGIAVLFVRFVS